LKKYISVKKQTRSYRKKERTKMQKNKNKISAIAISILFILSMTASLTLISPTTAHTPIWKIPTFAYIVAEPNPIGVGQSMNVYMWLDCVYGAAGGTGAAVGTDITTTGYAQIGNSYRFHNYQLIITAPDGTNTTKTFPVIEDTTSSQQTTFTPTSVGTYTLTFNYPGQVYGEGGNGYSGSALINDTYLPSSASTKLIVQQDPIQSPLTSAPIPTEYWSHPIYGQNTDWWTISSNWLGSGSPILEGYTSSTLFHPDAVGPLTSHVMWTRQLQTGGVVGGNAFVAGGSDPNENGQGVAYFEGSSYQPRFVNPIIVGGYLYYTTPISFTGQASGPTVCVDLRTGNTMWSRTDIPSLSFGYVYNLWNPDQHGVFNPILFTSNFGQAFDAYTGTPLFNVTGVPSGTSVAGPSGEQLRYVLANAGNTTNPQWYLSQWNSSKLWQYINNPYTSAYLLSPSIINASNGLLIQTIPVPFAGTTGSLPPNATTTSNAVPYGSTLIVQANIPKNSAQIAPGSTNVPLSKINNDQLTTYDWNTSIPWRNTMTLTPTVISANYNDMLLCRNGTLPSGFAASNTGTSQAPYTMFAINLNASKGTIGSLLWMKNYDPPASNITMQLPSVDYQNRVFVYQYYETMQWVGYNLDTGAQIWGPTEPETAFNYYDWSGYNPGVIAYGNLYSGGFGGVTYCFNDLTGELRWTWGNGDAGNSTRAGFNTPYGVYPTFIQSISNGVVYLATDEHTIPNPLYKGATLEAINATTGNQIWQISGYPSEWASSGSEWATADGYLTCMNGYDNNVYSLGKGPSSMTANVQPFGSAVVVSGRVIDISAGTKQDEQAARFPSGVPVASDDSMGSWMGYVYQQATMPTDFIGVPVSLSVVDSNGNYRNIGTAKTDVNGYYSLTWKPDIPGDFTVYATFAGSNAYWGSHTLGSFYFSEPTATLAPTQAQITSASDTYLLPGIIAIIIAIAIVGVVLALLVTKKRP
jgi:outer membrane protein assembly factor BamB